MGTGRVVLRYVDGSGRPAEANPNGAARSIADHQRKGSLGLMPHPERCAESILGGEDGRRVFLSMIKSLESGALASR